MEINVKTRSEAKRGFVLAVANYIAHELGIQDTKIKLNISLVYRLKEVRQFLGGLAVERSEGGAYEMYLDSRLGVGRMIEAIAHEMVHVKQRYRGMLRFKKAKRGGFTCIWLGKINRKHYRNQPWERIAYTQEKVLGNRVIDILNAG